MRANVLFGFFGAVLGGIACLSAQESGMHPPVRLLDGAGKSVLETGGPVSAARTCGACHDSRFIQTHSYHVCVGLREIKAPGKVPGGRPWDISPGAFGRWNPLFYRYLTPKGDPKLDLGTADWIRLFGGRHVGYGPARFSRDLKPLESLPLGPKGDPETWVLDPVTATPRPWDWKKSGTEDMDCFLCHLPRPAEEAREAELRAGRFRWADTATLSGTGLVEKKGGTWTWKKSAFGPGGRAGRAVLPVSRPTCTNCGLCHGKVHHSKDPLVLKCDLDEEYTTETTGQVCSGQRIGASGLNLKGKSRLLRPWDIHAERAVECVHCHFSLNHPGLYKERNQTRPSFLTFDPRIMDLGPYLKKPNHHFAKGHAAQYPGNPLLRGSVRRCLDCHDFEKTHEWLPYAARHAEKLRCEACHVPHMYAPARKVTDWTVLTPEGGPRVERRGVDGPACDIRSLITGFDPVLLPGRLDPGGGAKLTPCNLITFWYWVEGPPERPVRLADLKKAFFQGKAYHPDLLAVLDTDKDGKVEPGELKLDTSAKVEAVRKRLLAVGVKNPRIRGEIQPYSIHHDIAGQGWAVKDCGECHSRRSRITQPFSLASFAPGGVTPRLVGDSSMTLDPSWIQHRGKALVLVPSSRGMGLFVLGRDRVKWIDKLGIVLFVLTLLGVFAHGGGRILASLARKRRG